MIEVFVDSGFYQQPGDVVPANGAVLTWNSGQPSAREVTFGTDAFLFVADGIAAIDEGGTVWVAASSNAAPTSITKDCLIRGSGATLTLSAPIVVSGAAVRFRDLTLDSNGGTVAAVVKATSNGTVGLTHCTVNGPATVGLLADGLGSGVVANGCTFTGTIGTNVSTTDSGAAATFARTAVPVGGSCGRRGNWLRHRLLIEAPAERRDASKGQVIVWVPVDVCYGSIEPLRADEHMEARLAASNATHKIELPGGLTITPAFRVTWRERRYELGGRLTTDTEANRDCFLALERVA